MQACIGDVFTLGSVRLQIAQPRTPCWKIDARCGVEGVAAHVAEHGLAGWYFRVLSGRMRGGRCPVHVERLPGAVSLARFNHSLREARPSLQLLDLLASAPGLTPDWVRKIRSRMEWLQNNKDAV
jgi:MOSC domain-containing protein YiiM